MNRQLYMGGGIMSLSKEGIGGGSIKGVDMGRRIGFLILLSQQRKPFKKLQELLKILQSLQ